jgi:hypothetical protein
MKIDGTIVWQWINEKKTTKNNVGNKSLKVNVGKP